MLQERTVIYREKSLDYFKVTNKNSFYACFCKALWATQATMLQKGIVWRNVARLFNDAHYIYEEVNLSHCPERKMTEYREYMRPKIGYSTKEATLVVNTKMIAVYWLLHYSPGRARAVDDFMKSLEEDLQTRCSSLFDAFYHEMYGGNWQIRPQSESQAQCKHSSLRERLISTTCTNMVIHRPQYINAGKILEELNTEAQRFDDKQELNGLLLQIIAEMISCNLPQIGPYIIDRLMQRGNARQTNANICIDAENIYFNGKTTISEVTKNGRIA